MASRKKLGGELIKELSLTDDEIGALDRALDLASQAETGKLNFALDAAPKATTLAAAALVIGVANLTFSLYTEYGKSIADRKDIGFRLKKLAGDLVELESVEENGTAVNVLSKLRDEVRDAKRSIK
ncbi:hypothetical protein [Litorimonas sp. WD9-15]|uniref:hypothetical protein n=1 Tax=Litorimonas sp. WD9-15 TaxID=3418716 RepID=UPI003D04CFAE